MTIDILHELFQHGDWANKKLLDLSASLSDEQLDQPREMGFGTLRNTFFHIYEAERLWMDRFRGEVPAPFRIDADGMSLAEISSHYAAVRQVRDQLLDDEAKTDYLREIQFTDLANRQWTFPVGDLLNHLSNHGVHHRAQVLNFLKPHGIKVPGGVDYIFYKLAFPTCVQPQESVPALEQYGLEVGSELVPRVEWDHGRILKYFAHDDWALRKVFEAVAHLDDKLVDATIDMGMGSLRKNLQHIIDAWRWWLGNWSADGSAFPRGEAPRSLLEMQAQAQEAAHQRLVFIKSLDQDSADRIVSVTAGGPTSCFRVTESLMQLCVHGTHHLAQCLNMMRQLGGTPPSIDLISWLRENN
ncbi:MAG: hypothetical protein Aurels2KO_14710 [Aureliella sp.]